MKILIQQNVFREHGVLSILLLTYNSFSKRTVILVLL